MKGRSALAAAALALLACSSGPEDVPEAVAPVEVGAAQPSEDVAQLRARVDELERELAACQAGDAERTTAEATDDSASEVHDGVQSAELPAVIPEGVDVPAERRHAASRRPDAGTQHRRTGASRDPSLLERVLGDDSPGDDGSLHLPDPTGLLGQ